MAFTTINKSSDYFVTNLWTGNDTAQTITGIPFAPDFVWIKNRSAAESHTLVNTVIGANNFLKSNAASANNTNSEFLKSFTSDGYTLGNADEVNNGSNNIVGWNWKANGQGSSNTDGSINTTYTSANTTSGFSIVQYTGTGANATVGHGLGISPKMIILKQTNTSKDWMIYHKYTNPNGTGSQYYLHLNSSDGKASNATMWQNTDPTSSLFSLGSSSNVNGSSDTYIAYCFAEVQGYSKISSYVGNGNVDGSFIHTGFKPAYVIAKRTDGASNWNQFDNKRFGFNVKNPLLYPNLTNLEADDVFIDLLSNGFKWRTTNGDINASGGSYIYMAFAEAPLVGTNNVPANAR
tara:strand:+ start:119 stop:1165 length:1047 start_codon:yes stop_codon:yes gene_type:complete